jgi:hypothetical protein
MDVQEKAFARKKLEPLPKRLQVEAQIWGLNQKLDLAFRTVEKIGEIQGNPYSGTLKQRIVYFLKKWIRKAIARHLDQVKNSLVIQTEILRSTVSSFQLSKLDFDEALSFRDKLFSGSPDHLWLGERIKQELGEQRSVAVLFKDHLKLKEYLGSQYTVTDYFEGGEASLLYVAHLFELLPALELQSFLRDFTCGKLKYSHIAMLLMNGTLEASNEMKWKDPYVNRVHSKDTWEQFFRGFGIEVKVSASEQLDGRPMFWMVIRSSEKVKF